MEPQGRTTKNKKQKRKNERTNANKSTQTRAKQTNKPKREDVAINKTEGTPGLTRPIHQEQKTDLVSPQEHKREAMGKYPNKKARKPKGK